MKRLFLLIAMLALLAVPGYAQVTFSGGVSGSVTRNCVPKATVANTIATTVICDDGTTTSINTNKVTVTNASGNTAIAGTLTVTGAITASGGLSNTGALTVTSPSASSLAVGRLGATTPAFVVDSSTGSQVAGLKVTGAATGGTVAVVAIDSGADTNLTINAKGTGTIGIGSASTGAVTITPATTVTGALTPTGGVAAAGGFSASPRLIHSGGAPPQVSTDGSDYTVVATEVLIAEVFVPANMSITGVSLLNGSAVAGNVKVGLANSAGVVVATSASTAQAGTDAYQRIPFTGAYAAKGPATYYILAIGDTGGGTSLINTHTFGDFGAAKQTGQVFATGFTTITPPTTFTTGLGPIASLY